MIDFPTLTFVCLESAQPGTSGARNKFKAPGVHLAAVRHVGEEPAGASQKKPDDAVHFVVPQRHSAEFAINPPMFGQAAK